MLTFEGLVQDIIQRRGKLGSKDSTQNFSWKMGKQEGDGSKENIWINTEYEDVSNGSEAKKHSLNVES